MSRSNRPQLRTIRLIRPPDPNGVAIVCLRDADQATFYTLCEIPCEIGGRGFALHRTGLGTLYHLRIGTAEECDCDCLGFLRHGHCKHVLGLLALLQAGRWPVSTRDCLPLSTATEMTSPSEGKNPAERPMG
ncbi:MAG: SWIM zinc finger family protein [Gemmataceae bacterium]